MAGLLDFFASSQDDPRYGMNLAFFKGLANRDVAGGLLAGQQAQDQRQDRVLKRGLLEAQIADTLAQAEERKATSAARAKRLDYVNGWMRQLDDSVPQANQAVIGQTGGLAPTLANAGLQTQELGRINANNPIVGIPRQAIMGDLAINDGKNIPEWMFKRGVPDMQVSGGYAFDKNRVQPGFMPQLNVSQDGKGSLITIGPDGQPRMSAPQGSLDTYSAFRAADEGAKAASELVQVYNPQTRQMEFKPKSSVLGQQPQAPQRAPAGLQRSSLTQPGDADRQLIFTNELAAAEKRLAAAQTPAERERAQTDVASLQREMARNGIGAPAASAPSAAGAPIRSPGQETVDKEFGKDYATFVAGGGYADISKQLEQLNVAADALKEGSGLTGPLIGLMPDKLLTMTNPKAANVKELVQESVQRNLRLVLGAQFTEKEGERLISRAYNPMLPPEENQRRAQRLIKQIQSAAESKADAARYFEANGTLAGWNGRLPTFSDFSPEGRDASGKVTNAPKSAAPGVKFDPDKERRYQEWKARQGK